jgi:hypothetical protein
VGGWHKGQAARQAVRRKRVLDDQTAPRIGRDCEYMDHAECQRRYEMWFAEL